MYPTKKTMDKNKQQPEQEGITGTELELIVCDNCNVSKFIVVGKINNGLLLRCESCGHVILYVLTLVKNLPKKLMFKRKLPLGVG